MFNNFADAPEVRVNSTRQFDNVGNDMESFEPSVANMGATAWLKFVAPSSGDFTFHTRNSAIDTILAIYLDEGSGPDIQELTPVGDNDDFDFGDDGVTSKVVATLVGGETYYIQVAGFDAEEGMIHLTVAAGDFAGEFRLPTQSVSIVT